MRKYLILIALTFLTTLSLVGCAGGAEDGNGDGENKGTIIIGLNNWAENIAVSNMWKVILEEKGYTVNLKAMEKSPVWAGIARKDLDLAPEVWLPTTDKPLYEEYKDKIELHETWYKGTGLGLVVPKYMDINSIEELNAKKEQLGITEIVGIDPGASLMKLTRDAVKEYKLDYELIESSGPAMMSELQSAYKNEEPIVVTLWNPHWAFAEYELKYLEDPKKVYGEPDDIYFMTRKGFGDDFPEVLKWMNNWKMDDKSLGTLMAVIKESGDPAEGAKQWIEDNQELVDKWTQSDEEK
ncbi:glycine betaine ABC transporter substrate-binding protein [Alkalihalobacillus sp. AL-G]|uniref:glycine betaine ABC transporter substrate-binding protein n=1 Tax=Alkalihalobacillus sp. AL-G TaxID=2926399 RepID=UPI002729520B|nr:glycine betaine ABC transporter substrate-binding protein [Alkalihalobacillus sp. AL-G]WLD93430.1 glycine betaine ABC transporter substrate-binding protein [Alkalihalobacillus sp. AL-G]